MPKKIEYYILESSMNKTEKFEVIESIATFEHKGFLLEIKDNLKYYGMSIESLSKSCGMSNFRLNALLNGNANFEQEEINKIKNRLHI